MLPCPAESTNLSRSDHRGLRGLWRRCRVHSTYPIVAAPMGSPGCPEFAFWTASIESVRIVLMQSSSIVWICVAIQDPPTTASSPRRPAPPRASTFPPILHRIWSGIAGVQWGVSEGAQLRLDLQVSRPRLAVSGVPLGIGREHRAQSGRHVLGARGV